MHQLKETLSQYWHHIQGNLFPWLQEELGLLNKKQRQLITVLDMARVEEHLSRYRGCVGSRTAIARAFVAKAVYQFSIGVDKSRSHDSRIKKIGEKSAPQQGATRVIVFNGGKLPMC